MSDQSTAGRLRGLAPSLDSMQEQRREEQPRHGTADEIARKLSERADRPTASLANMIDQAKEALPTLKSQRETLESMREVQQRQADEFYKSTQEADQRLVDQLMDQIAATRRAMEERTAMHKQKCKDIDAAIDQEVGAVDKMIAAQRGVISAGEGDDMPF